MIGRRLRMLGLVQGVSFRDWAVRAARSGGLTGWVRNRRDGSVEALVVGKPDAVEAFAADCLRGPGTARVDRVDQREHSALAIEGFTILPTVQPQGSASRAGELLLLDAATGGVGRGSEGREADPCVGAGLDRPGMVLELA